MGWTAKKGFSSPQYPDRLWGPHSLLIQWVPGPKSQGREVYHSPLSNAEVNNGGAVPLAAAAAGAARHAARSGRAEVAYEIRVENLLTISPEVVPRIRRSGAGFSLRSLGFTPW